MTTKTYTRDASGNPVKTPGWFSWRHQSRDAHDEAVARYQAEHGPEARRRKAAERNADFEASVSETAERNGLTNRDEARRIVVNTRAAARGYVGGAA